MNGATFSAFIIFAAGCLLWSVKDVVDKRDVKLAEQTCEQHEGWTGINPGIFNTMHIHCADGFKKSWMRITDGDK